MPNTASSAATRRSHITASSSPPATACPSTAAITGLPNTIRVGPIGPSSVMSVSTRFPPPPATAFRSAPAQNVPPAPVRTATDNASSASNRRNLSDRARCVGTSTALRACRRSIVITHTGPSISKCTVSLVSSTSIGRRYRSHKHTSQAYHRSVATAAHPSWLVDSDYDVDAFRELVSRKTDHADVPHAVTIDHNVPVYDGEALYDIARDPARRRGLLGELAWVLGQGPGVLAVQRGLTERNRLSEATAIFNEIIAEQHAAGRAVGDHFAKPGSNDRVWNSHEKLAERAPDVASADAAGRSGPYRHAARVRSDDAAAVLAARARRVQRLAAGRVPAGVPRVQGAAADESRRRGVFQPGGVPRRGRQHDDRLPAHEQPAAGLVGVRAHDGDDEPRPHGARRLSAPARDRRGAG